MPTSTPWKLAKAFIARAQAPCGQARGVYTYGWPGPSPTASYMENTTCSVAIKRTPKLPMWSQDSAGKTTTLSSPQIPLGVATRSLKSPSAAEVPAKARSSGENAANGWFQCGEAGAGLRMTTEDGLWQKPMLHEKVPRRLFPEDRTKITEEYKNILFTVWDLGGQTRTRQIWQHYYQPLGGTQRQAERRKC